MNAIKAKEEILLLSRLDRVTVLKNFFKTGKGEYAEGDIFTGAYVPEIRMVARKYEALKLPEVLKLLKSKIHEIRLLALLILVLQFKKSSSDDRQKIFDFYLKNTRFINNWDLVDLSARDIVGVYLFDRKKGISVLLDLARSKDMWERRISIIATYAFIMKGSSSETFRISKILLNDKEDLIHKAVGWMLREVGKRVERDELVKFIEQNYKELPRTALRYAIEHFESGDRAYYLSYGKTKI